MVVVRFSKRMGAIRFHRTASHRRSPWCRGRARLGGRDCRNSNLPRSGPLDGELGIAPDKVGVGAFRLVCDCEAVAAAQHFFPENTKLLFGQLIADTAVDTRAERQVAAGILAVYPEGVGFLEYIGIAVAGDVSKYHFVAGFNGFSGQFGISGRGSPHVDDGGLPADGF